MPASSSLRAASRRVATIVVLLALLLGLQPPRPVHAATYDVDRFDDAYSVWACTAAPNDCTLRGAIRKSMTTPEADTILVPAGTFYLAPAMYPGQPDDEWGDIHVNPDGDLTIQGAGNSATIIDAVGGATGDCAFYYMPSASGTLSLINLKITGGAAGAIIAYGSLSLTGVILEGNSASGSGGGLYSWGTGQTLTLAGVTIRNNQAGLRGGGISQHGGVLNLTESDVSDNHVLTNGTGGGIALDSSVTGFSFDLVTISGNSTPSGFGGGGLAIAGGSGTLSRVWIQDNVAGGSGGGLTVAGTTTLTLTNSVVSGNTSEGNGGGVNINDGTTVTIERSEISGNVSNSATSSGGGGAIYFWDSTLTLRNSTVSGNTAKANGGGLCTILAGTSATIDSSTITANASDSDGLDGGSGGGLYLGNASVTLVGSIIAGNTGVQCVRGLGTLDSGGYNLSSDDSCELDGPGDLPSTAPKLGPLDDNTGINMTHALLPGSPAIDAGDASYCPPTDQRGVTRPIGAECDIGAYEAPVWVWLPLVFRQFP